jgi:hypothetical protein
MLALVGADQVITVDGESAQESSGYAQGSSGPV